MMNLPPDQAARLQELNDAVSAAIAARCDYLEARVREHATIGIGEGIYDIRSGRCLGVVRRRWWSIANGFTVEYEYETAPGIFAVSNELLGNTFGSRRDLR